MHKLTLMTYIKPGSVQVNFKITDILTYYRPEYPNPKDYILPELKDADPRDPVDIERKVDTATTKFNKALKVIATQANIEKNLLMHIARHSFGNIVVDKIPIHSMQKLYRYSSIITTANYQQSFMNKDMDDAIDKMLCF
jgi:integrase/recombinase XerD